MDPGEIENVLNDPKNGTNITFSQILNYKF